MKTTNLFKFKGSNFLLSLGAFFAFSVASAQTYCTPPDTDCTEGDEIVNVNFAGINYTSTCNAGTGYSDFTTTVAPAQVTIGQPYTLYVTANGSGVGFGAWIDYNQDGTFSADEFIDLGGAFTSGEVLEANITIPFTATPGITRMRLKATYDYYVGAEGACTEAPFFGYGEFEDYAVNISAGTACSGVPTAGTITAPSAICASTAFTLTASGTSESGMTYQWQMSVDAGTTWTNLGTPQLSPVFPIENQSQATSYRVIKTCTNSNESVTYPAVAVTQTPFYQCYCTNEIAFNCADGDLILNVTFGNATNNINNTSGCDSANGYSDYRSTVTPAIVTPGSSVPVSVTVGPSGEGWLYESVGVWIDFNQNGVFELSEYTYVGTGLNTVLTNNIAIPADALPGTTGMRVLVSAAIGPQDDGTGFSHAYVCGPLDANNNFGEIEDYLVTISDVASAGEFNLAGLTVYPNPTTGIANINSETNAVIETIEVYSVSGQLISSKKYASQADSYMIDLSGVATGIYFAKITTNMGSDVKRIVKQ